MVPNLLVPVWYENGPSQSMGARNFTYTSLDLLVWCGMFRLFSIGYIYLFGVSKMGLFQLYRVTPKKGELFATSE